MLRSKLGIACMVPKPRMPVYAPRAIVRHSVETGLKELGIMDFVDEMMEAELTDKINRLMETLLQKFSYMLRNNIKARHIFGNGLAFCRWCWALCRWCWALFLPFRVCVAPPRSATCVYTHTSARARKA